MNLCFFSHSSSLGGGERSLLYLIKSLNKYPDIKMLIILPSRGKLCDKLDIEKINYIIYPYKWWTVERGGKRISSSFLLDEYLTTAKRLSRVIYDYHPNLIITNTSVICIGALVANILKVPHIWYIRELGEKDHGFIFKFGFAHTARFINSNSVKVIFNSNATKKEFTKYISAKKSIVVYNSISIDKDDYYKQIPFRFKFKNSFKLLIAGTVSQKKGQVDAIKAVSYLLAHGVNVELLIIGTCTDDLLRLKINDLVKKSKRSNHFQIMQNVDNPYPLFRQCNAVLVCSKNEAFGRTIIEGMLAKKPIIATNSGGVPEIINNHVNGLLYVPGNYKQLAHQIKSLTTNTRLQKDLSINGYQTAITKFSNIKYSQKLANIFRSTIHKPSLGDAFLLSK